ncbi:hypothetical protein Ancab_028706 [Ancistrocladus abbreviatus]
MVVYNVEEHVVNRKDEEVSSPLEEEPPSLEEEERGVSDIEGYDDNSIPPPSIKFVDALNTATVDEVKNNVEGAHLSSERNSLSGPHSNWAGIGRIEPTVCCPKHT